MVSVAVSEITTEWKRKLFPANIPYSIQNQAMSIFSEF